MGPGGQVLLQALHRNKVKGSPNPDTDLTRPHLVADHLGTAQSDLRADGGLGLTQPLLQVDQEGLVPLELSDPPPPLQHRSLDLGPLGLGLSVESDQEGPAAGQ